MNYYNEFDPKAAAWLRELIAAKQIPAGLVDERSIAEVKPSDLYGYTQCHFFAGIGGWPLALRIAGWPDDEPVWTGSCPCQPFSAAGKQMGRADSRHLFPTWRRLINRCAPPVVFGEQVASALGREWLARVRSQMEIMGYGFRAADLCAAGLGSPQIRQRLFWVGHAGSHERGAGWTGFANGNGAQQLAGSGDAGGLDNTDGNGAQRTGREEFGAVTGCATRRLAGPDGGHPGAERQQRGGQHGQWQEDGGASGVAHPTSQRWGQTGRDITGDLSTAGTGARDWVGDGSEALRTAPPWSRHRLIACSDGKTRRVPVESEFFPLASRIPGRVGLLRGYGNAIVPQVAAEFIRACEDSTSALVPASAGGLTAPAWSPIPEED